MVLEPDVEKQEQLSENEATREVRGVERFFSNVCWLFVVII